MPSSSPLRVAKRAAARCLERIYGAALAGVGRCAPATAASWSSSGDQRILVVSPHPDDEAVGCAGTLIRHVRAGDRTCIVMATDGRLSKMMPDPDAMAAQRRREAGEAARLMGIHRFEWLGLPEGDWAVAALARRLRALIDEFSPDIVYAPSRIDFHPEHLAVAHALAVALEQLPETPGRNLRVRVYQIQVPLDPGAVNLICDVSDLRRECEQVLQSYVSQSGSIEPTFRLRRYCARLHRVSGQAEGFWQLDARQYVALHRKPCEDWPRSFRGLRYFPLSDPLAYWVGCGARFKLRALAT